MTVFIAIIVLLLLIVRTFGGKVCGLVVLGWLLSIIGSFAVPILFLILFFHTR